MTISSKSTNRKNEYLGISLFLIGTLPLVLVTMLLLRPPLPGQEMTFLQAFSSSLVGAFGSAAVLMVSCALTGFGGWMFTGGAISDPMRHLTAIIGMGAVLLQGTQIGEESLVAAGSLVAEGGRYTTSCGGCRCSGPGQKGTGWKFV